MPAASAIYFPHEQAAERGALAFTGRAASAMERRRATFFASLAASQRAIQEASPTG